MGGTAQASVVTEVGVGETEQTSVVTEVGVDETDVVISFSKTR